MATSVSAVVALQHFPPPLPPPWAPCPIPIPSISVLASFLCALFWFLSPLSLQQLPWLCPGDTTTLSKWTSNSCKSAIYIALMLVHSGVRNAWDTDFCLFGEVRIARVFSFGCCLVDVASSATAATAATATAATTTTTAILNCISC